MSDYYNDRPRPTANMFDKWRPTGKPTISEEDLAIREENKEFRRKKHNELVEDMLDIILRHKKELRKVPQASHINGAIEWGRKRGLEAREVDIGGDPEKEVVVFAKDNKTPYVVNGYKLAPSDYPVRREYWQKHPKESDRVREPMHDWLRKSGTIYSYEDDGNFGKKNIKLTELGQNLEKWGYRMPAKPKKRESPYSVFSTLIAPMVKNMFRSPWIVEKLNIEGATELIRDSDGTPLSDEQTGAPKTRVKNLLYYPLIWSKIISPITIYRFLYLRLVEQKHYFVIKRSGVVSSYKQYKAWLKRAANAQEFNNWFFKNILNDDQTGFNSNVISKTIIDQNMIRGAADLSGDDKNDGLIQLFGGGANFLNKDTVVYVDPTDNTPAYFADIVLNEEVAKELYNILDDPRHPQYRQAKTAITIFKETATEWIKQELLSAEGLRQMMEDEAAYTNFNASLTATNEKSPNVTSQEGLDHYAKHGGSTSPVKAEREPTGDTEE